MLPNTITKLYKLPYMDQVASLAMVDLDLELPIDELRPGLTELKLHCEGLVVSHDQLPLEETVLSLYELV